MPDPLDALILDLLAWIAAQPRSSAQVMDAWHTSCPRLPVWEEANTRGFVTREHRDGREATVSVTAAGLAWLAENRRPAPGAPVPPAS